MSTKYFGEFLILKKVISSKDLVEALIEQIRQQPPLCQLAFEEKILTSEQMVEVFRIQQDLGIDFISGCKKLGIYNSEFSEKIENALNKVRMPLGQLLVGKGVIDLKNLTRMLDEFLSQCEVPGPKVKEVHQMDHGEDLFKEVSPEEFHDLPSGIISELEDVFDERKHKVIKVAMAFIKDKSAVDPNAVSKLFRDSLKVIHTVNGLLKLFGIEELSKLMSSMERVIEFHLKSESSLGQHQQVADLLYRSFDEAWKVRNSIVLNQTEKNYFMEASSKASFKKILEELNGAVKDG